MPDITMEVLENKIDNLTQKVDVGFKSMEIRQNTTNGNIIANKEKITLLEKEDIHIRNKFKLWKGYWLITGLLVSTILTLLGKYVF